ncbi:carboxypeptidase-like regulatory domain-containing protein, partial [bacterium]|nr:carboxypeptidase-like regulatory domain-containing protein [bacterium]
MEHLRYWTGSLRNMMWLLTTLLCTLLCLAGASDAQSTNAADYLGDENLIILELRIGSAVVSPGMIAFQHPGGVLMPLGALTDVLEFAIEVSPAQGRAAGWFISESRRFSLDLASRVVVSDGQTHACPPGVAASDNDDIYIDTAQLSAWFPFTIEVKVGQLLAKLTPRETLPLQSRLKREAIRTRHLDRGALAERLPLQVAEYRLFTWPLVDANFEYRGREPDMTPRFSIQSSGDVGTLATDVFVTHTEGAKVINATRLRAGRTDAYGALLGPLQATEFSFGDLYAPSTPLVLRGKLGRGLLLSNRPLRRPDRFDSTEISGDGPPGWEAELYGNNTLLDFGTIDETGRYLFTEVPLVFGLNTFRTVLYGPQGQMREYTRDMNVGASMIAPGRLEYRLFGVQDERFLVTGDDLLDDTPDRGRWTGHLEAGYGLGKPLSLQGGWTRQPLEGVEHDYLSLNASGCLAGYYLQAVGVNALDGGSAGSFSLRGRLFARSLTAEQFLYRDFVSDANPVTQQRTDETRVRLGGSTTWGNRNLAYDLQVQTTGYTGRGITRQDQMQLRAATLWRGLQMSTKLEYRNSRSSLGDYDQIFLDQLARGIWGPLLLRGSLSSRLRPTTSLKSVSGSAYWNPLGRLRLGAHATHRFDGAIPTTLGGSLGLLMDTFSVAFSANAAGEQKPYLSLAISTSVTKVPETMRMHVQRQRMSEGYGASARVFLDRNANGLYDDQDAPLPEVRITGAGAWNEAVTGSNGIAYLAGLPAHRERDLSLDLTSLQDPFLLPSGEGVRATGHPGGHVVLEFPVTYSGDIEGTVYARTPGGDIPLRNIGLELVDLAQRSVRKTVSEFDGYYLFQEIPPGWYEIHVIPETIARKNLRLPPPVAAA